jgi:hypothetical protein
MLSDSVEGAVLAELDFSRSGFVKINKYIKINKSKDSFSIF